MSKVFIEEATLTGIADAIRSKEGSAEKIPTTQMAERIGALSGESPLVNHAKTIQLHSLNDLGRSVAEVSLPEVTSIFRFCDLSTPADTPELVNTTVEELTLRCGRKQESASGFLRASNYNRDSCLKKLTLYADLSGVANLSYFLANMVALEAIEGDPLDFSAATNLAAALSNLLALRELRFQGSIQADLSVSQSKLLSKGSIQSLLSCLSGTVSGKTLTLSLQAVDAAFETAEGAADGSESAEWMALVDSKPNWTISLV